MYCSNCGTQNEDNNEFCLSCGQPLKPPLEKLKAKGEEIKVAIAAKSSELKETVAIKMQEADAMYKQGGNRFIIDGIIAILGGFALFGLLPMLAYELPLPELLRIVFRLLSYLAPIAGLVAGIYILAKQKSFKQIMQERNQAQEVSFEAGSTVPQPSTTQFQSSPSNSMSNMAKQNKIIKLTFTGGLIGLFAGNETGSLRNAIAAANKDRWKVVQIIPDNSGNILTIIGRLLLLMITIGFFTFNNGYYIIFEKEL
jgi:hypothetical protein